jgi:hypothetical protein
VCVCTGSFAEKVTRQTAAASSLAASVADQIAVRLTETKTQSHTAGFEVSDEKHMGQGSSLPVWLTSLCGFHRDSLSHCGNGLLRTRIITDCHQQQHAGCLTSSPTDPDRCVLTCQDSQRTPAAAAAAAAAGAAGVQAWLRSRGTTGASVYTADTIAEHFGVVKSSYDGVPLTARSVLTAVCKGPGRPQDQVHLVVQELPAELEWGQVGKVVKIHWST